MGNRFFSAKIRKVEKESLNEFKNVAIAKINTCTTNKVSTSSLTTGKVKLYKTLLVTLCMAYFNMSAFNTEN